MNKIKGLMKLGILTGCLVFRSEGDCPPWSKAFKGYDCECFFNTVPGPWGLKIKQEGSAEVDLTDGCCLAGGEKGGTFHQFDGSKMSFRTSSQIGMSQGGTILLKENSRLIAEAGFINLGVSKWRFLLGPRSNFTLKNDFPWSWRSHQSLRFHGPFTVGADADVIIGLSSAVTTGPGSIEIGNNAHFSIGDRSYLSSTGQEAEISLEISGNGSFIVEEGSRLAIGQGRLVLQSTMNPGFFLGESTTLLMYGASKITINSGASFYVESFSRVMLGNGSNAASLDLKTGSSVRAGHFSSITLGRSSSLEVASGSSFLVHSFSSVDIGDGSSLLVFNGLQFTVEDHCSFVVSPNVHCVLFNRNYTQTKFKSVVVGLGIMDGIMCS